MFDPIFANKIKMESIEYIETAEIMRAQFSYIV